MYLLLVFEIVHFHKNFSQKNQLSNAHFYTFVDTHGSVVSGGNGIWSAFINDLRAAVGDWCVSYPYSKVFLGAGIKPKYWLTVEIYRFLESAGHHRPMCVYGGLRKCMYKCSNKKVLEQQTLWSPVYGWFSNQISSKFFVNICLAECILRTKFQCSIETCPRDIYNFY